MVLRAHTLQLLLTLISIITSFAWHFVRNAERGSSHEDELQKYLVHLRMPKKSSNHELLFSRVQNQRTLCRRLRESKRPVGSESVLQMLSSSGSISSFASLEEQIAHLNWRKVCNERQIQGTLRLSKQLQERDEFLRAAKSDNKDKREWMHSVIKQEFSKPLPLVAHQFDEMTSQLQEDDKRVQLSAKKHMAQIKSIQSKLDAREAQLLRKKEFERKKKELFEE